MSSPKLVSIEIVHREYRYVCIQCICRILENRSNSGSNSWSRDARKRATFYLLSGLQMQNGFIFSKLSKLIFHFSVSVCLTLTIIVSLIFLLVCFRKHFYEESSVYTEERN